MTTSHSDEALAGDAAQGSRDKGTRSGADCAAADAWRKRLATVRTHLAFRGFELRESTGGPLLIVKWGLVREANSIEAAESFARQVGAQA